MVGIRKLVHADQEAPKLTEQNLVVWQSTYAWCLPFVKSSICLSLFRITSEKNYRIMLWAVMILASISALIGFIAVVITCRPIAKNWDPVLQADPSVGYCLDYGIIQGISYYISASSIITDWACAIIPCFIVWNLQMRRKVKISVASILALGAMASVTTIIRVPYLGAYTAASDRYCKLRSISTTATSSFVPFRGLVHNANPRLKTRCAISLCGPKLNAASASSLVLYRLCVVSLRISSTSRQEEAPIRPNETQALWGPGKAGVTLER